MELVSWKCHLAPEIVLVGAFLKVWLRLDVSLRVQLLGYIFIQDCPRGFQSLPFAEVSPLRSIGAPLPIAASRPQRCCD